MELMACHYCGTNKFLETEFQYHGTIARKAKPAKTSVLASVFCSCCNCSASRFESKEVEDSDYIRLRDELECTAKIGGDESWNHQQSLLAKAELYEAMKKPSKARSL